MGTLLIMGCGRQEAPESGSPGEVSFWVWHRTRPLPDAELQRLEELGVSSVFQHVANFTKQDTSWTWESVCPVSNKRIVPVIRIEAGENFASDPQGVSRLADAIRHHFDGVHEIQLDYDCPDRLLAEYAKALAVLRNEFPEIRLSVTALAGWIGQPGFDHLAANVHAIFPMFYDLEPDSADAVKEGEFHPIAGSAMQVELIQAWADCEVPWHAGLPNFSRLSVFDSDGNLKGHLRDWRWDEVIFHPWLVPVDEASRMGITRLRATQSTRLGNTLVEPGDHIVLRQPEWTAVQEMASAASAAGASGWAWFRLPGPGEPNAWSASHLVSNQSSSARPGLALLPDGRLRFQNSSPQDIPPGFHGSSGSNDRGWKLEIEVPEPGWILDAGAGEFMQMLAHYDPDAAEPLPVHPMRARRLTFWFSHLPAGAELNTASIYLEAGKDPGALRWRFDGGEWQALAQ